MSRDFRASSFAAASLCGDDHCSRLLSHRLNRRLVNFRRSARVLTLSVYSVLWFEGGPERRKPIQSVKLRVTLTLTEQEKACLSMLKPLTSLLPLPSCTQNGNCRMAPCPFAGCASKADRCKDNDRDGDNYQATFDLALDLGFRVVHRLIPLIDPLPHRSCRCILLQKTEDA